MLRIGLIGIGISVGLILLFMLLSAFGIAHFGSCGPDAVGLVLMIGVLLTGGPGVLITAGGLVKIGVERLRQSAE